MSEKEPFLKPLGPLEQKIADYVEPILALENCELVSLKVSGLKGRPCLALFIDRSSIEELSSLSRLLSNALDVGNAEANWFAGAYQLELSSPGLDRPLTKKSHFTNGISQMARVKTSSGTLRGVLKSVDPTTGISLEVDTVSSPIAWHDIREANIIYTPERAKNGK
ncbi:MAG: hypothetical protein V4534_08945 [Myxococcota bacterium]